MKDLDFVDSDEVLKETLSRVNSPEIEIHSPPPVKVLVKSEKFLKKRKKIVAALGTLIIYGIIIFTSLYTKLH